MIFGNYAIIYPLYIEDLPHWVKTCLVILSFYPPFNFAKIWSDIARYSGASLN